MSDELQGVIAELASRLGTTSGELLAWLQGDGLAEYARAKVARLIVETAGWGVLILACVIAAALAFRRLSKCDDSLEEDGLAFSIIVFVAASVVASPFFFMTASELAGWIASPQGMVISTLLDKVG